MDRAFSLAFDSAGSSIAARIAMIAMTTSNSISVNARRPPPDDIRTRPEILMLVFLFCYS